MLQILYAVVKMGFNFLLVNYCTLNTLLYS